jgi:hypothetical protein
MHSWVHRGTELPKREPRSVILGQFYYWLFFMIWAINIQMTFTLNMKVSGAFETLTPIY